MVQNGGLNIVTRLMNKRLWGYHRQGSHEQRGAVSWMASSFRSFFAWHRLAPTRVRTKQPQKLPHSRNTRLPSGNGGRKLLITWNQKKSTGIRKRGRDSADLKFIRRTGRVGGLKIKRWKKKIANNLPVRETCVLARVLCSLSRNLDGD